jgi:hypothetical protein
MTDSVAQPAIALGTYPSALAVIHRLAEPAGVANTITGDIARKLGHIRTLARDREMRAGMGEQRLRFVPQLRIFSADCGKKRRPFARLLSESSVIQRVNYCPALSFHHILPGPSTGEL